MSDEEEEN